MYLCQPIYFVKCELCLLLSKSRLIDLNVDLMTAKCVPVNAQMNYAVSNIDLFYCESYIFFLLKLLTIPWQNIATV